MTLPAISVVIPTYNRAGLIAQTLRAVLAQTLPAAEIIVIDDGSTDATAATLATFGETLRTHRIVNSGDLVARNAGLRLARHPLVAFCDSDDLWQPDFLAEMAAFWHAEPGLTAAFANFQLLRDGTVADRDKFADAPPGFWHGTRDAGPQRGVFDTPIVDRLLAFQPFFPSCMVAAREPFLALGGWDEGVSRLVGTDFATALRLAAAPPIGFARRPLVHIRKHASNFSADVERMNLGDAQILEYVLATRPALAPLADAFARSIAKRRADALDSAFSRRDFAAVRTIAQTIPRARQPLRQQVKAAIATLPAPLRQWAARALSTPR